MLIGRVQIDGIIQPDDEVFASRRPLETKAIISAIGEGFAVQFEAEAGLVSVSVSWRSHPELIKEEREDVRLLCDFLREAGAHAVAGVGAEAD